MGVYNLNRDDVVDNDKVEETKANDSVVEVNDNSTVEETVDTVSSATDEKKEVPTVVLDGPLSHVYTQALNAVYSKEDIGTMVMYGQAKDMEHTEGDVYAYCLDDLCSEDKDIVTAIEMVANKVKENRYKQGIVAIECNRVMNKNIDLITKYGSELGVKVAISRKSALESIRVSLENMSIKT